MILLEMSVIKEAVAAVLLTQLYKLLNLVLRSKLDKKFRICLFKQSLDVIS